jgi:hypothetical protein
MRPALTPLAFFHLALPFLLVEDETRPPLRRWGRRIMGSIAFSLAGLGTPAAIRARSSDVAVQLLPLFFCFRF